MRNQLASHDLIRGKVEGPVQQAGAPAGAVEPQALLQEAVGPEEAVEGHQAAALPMALEKGPLLERRASAIGGDPVKQTKPGARGPKTDLTVLRSGA